MDESNLKVDSSATASVVDGPPFTTSDLDHDLLGSRKPTEYAIPSDEDSAPGCTTDE